MQKLLTLILFLCFFISNNHAQQAPDFTFTDINGDTHNLSSALADGKVILLDFFFVNCGPCISLAPEIEAERKRINHACVGAA